jgi:hypothetical protein
MVIDAMRVGGVRLESLTPDESAASVPRVPGEVLHWGLRSPDGRGSLVGPPRRRLSARKGALMETLRHWHCRNCGRTNHTEVALDGHVKCETCHWVMRIQPSRARGGETPGQLYRRPLPAR